MQTEVVFHTPIGTIIGEKEEGVIRVLGIPYAQAKRYEKPTPANPFTETFHADSLSVAAPQLSSPVLEKVLGVDILQSLRMDENCLQLSMAIPENFSVDQAFPVMIWIYGGSYSSGAGDAVVYNPKLLVQEQNVIVVNINYRLGVLGFLGGFENRPANLGLLDMAEAVRWVKNNIASFGGDVDNITLFGQSAGGDAIAHLILVDDMENLVRNVIIQSAPLGIRKNRQKMTQKMVSIVRELSTDAPLSDVLATQENINRSMRKFGLKGGMPFGVQYGYFPLPKEIDVENVWRKKANQFNILIGYTDEETSLFAPFIPPLVWLRKSSKIGISIVKFFIKKTTDTIYRKSAQLFAKEMATNDGNVFLYNISWGTKNEFGATHTIDIPLLFGDEQTWKSAKLLEGIDWDTQYENGKKLRRIWGQFAKNGQAENEDISGLISVQKINY